MSQVWRKCGVCKKDIFLNSVYQRCSISSCKKFAFCSVDCWSQHDSVYGHKSAWAEEHRAPAIAESEDKPRRRIVSSPKLTAAEENFTPSGDVPKDILIVASKLKNYVKAKHGLNTSANVMDRLSDLVRDLCDEAVVNARNEGRKTLMDRDFLPPKR